MINQPTPRQMVLHKVSHYAGELKPLLPPEVLGPAPARLLWLPVHLTVIALATIAIAAGRVPWFFAPLLSLAIGLSFAGLTFLAHEESKGPCCA